MKDILDRAGYDEVRKVVAAMRHGHDREWRSFAAAWNAVLYRFQAALEADTAFSSSVKVSRTPPPDERYVQEESLFRFFASACSSLECLYFATYCIGAIIDSDAFPMDLPVNLKKYPRDVSDAFGARFAKDGLTAVLAKTLESAEFEALRNYRNFLSHRGSLPRHSHLGGDKDGSTYTPTNPHELSDSWVYDFEITEASTASARSWLETTIPTCIAELRSFTEGYLHSSAA